MDSFSEGVLERARQRSKMHQGVRAQRSTTTSAAASGTGDMSTSPRVNLKSKTKISTVVPGSPKGHMKLKHNVLNFQQDHFDMEIKLASMDKCLVQVEIQEQFSGSEDDNENDNAEPAVLREESHHRLRRLGKLYSAEAAGGEMSSPIHSRVEERDDGKTEGGSKSKMSQKGRSKLAALAHNIQQWENESPLPLHRAPMSPTAPAHTQHQQGQHSKPSTSQHRPISTVIHKKHDHQSTLELNDSVVNALESQGYTREDLDARQKLLTYKFSKDRGDEPSKRKDNHAKAPVTVSKTRAPANRLVEDEKRTPRGRPSMYAHNQPVRDSKDPSALSLHERKAIFERNADKTPLLPKSAFALNCPRPAVTNKPATKQARVNDQTSNDWDRVENDQNVRNTSDGEGRGERSAQLQQQGQGVVTNRLNALKGTRADSATISQRQIEAKMKEEIDRDMDLLLNRFHKPPPQQHQEHIQNIAEDTNEDSREVTPEKNGTNAAKPQKRRQSSEENEKSHNNSRSSVLDLSGCSAQVQSVLGDVREVRVRRSSHADRGRLYPVLSDIETATEGDANSDASDGMVEAPDETSLSLSMDSSGADGDTSAEQRGYEGDGCGGPTPPKCGKVHFKSPKSPAKYQPAVGVEAGAFTPTHVVEGDAVIPLQHTVSFYRKQQHQLNTPTHRRVTRTQQLDSILDDGDSDDDSDDSEVALAADDKVAQLRLDAQAQERTIAQASRALSLCNARLEFNGSTEQVEAERLLLLATHRRQAALYEIGRLQVQAAQVHTHVQVVRGDLVLGRLTLPLKREYVRALGAAGGSGHHVVCLLKCDDAKQQVLASRLVSTAASSAANTIDCIVEIAQPATLTLHAVQAGSTVSVEVYCLQARDQHLPHHVKYHIQAPATPRKLLPALLRGARDAAHDGNRMLRVPTESPGGPNTARTSSFALMGYAIFTVRSLLEHGGATSNSKHFTLSATPQMSPLEGSVEVGDVRCVWALPPVERRGFLTMYEDVTGFGAWHRRWFRLDGSKLRLCYWKYPDDESEREGRVIELRGFRADVGVVPREVCARLHTLLLQRRDAHDGGAGKYLLSADTKEERVAWCADLSRVLAAAATQHTT